VKRDARYVGAATLLMAALTYFLFRHLRDLDVSITNFALAYTVMFAYLAVTVFASLAARPHEPVAGFAYAAVSVDIFVPIYNEDPRLLAAGIASFARQSYPPHAVWLIDDGSDVAVFSNPVVRLAIARLRATGVEVAEHVQVNAGKREAQAWGFRRSSADVFVTVDSDTVLDENAIAQLLVPFGRENVMCVGGLAAGQNHTESILTRLIELGFVMAFLSGRMAEGYFGAVRVNCGILAAYRGDVVRENLSRYLNQTFMGRAVKIGDDRALTIFCKERGRAEFQPLAVAYSALPVTVSHLVRQRVRWARSWYWGTLWLLRRRVLSADFLLTTLQCLGMVCYLVTAVAGVSGLLSGQVDGRLIGWSLVTSMTIGMAFSFRYVLWGRPDVSAWDRVLTWLLSPLVSLLYLVLLVPLYWYAAFTLRPKDWGTRKTVEVGLHVVLEQTSDVA
jgi:cellulose synthase/poly-beta-1,6-N-acetylglucosamine synthase-like glycosyltransferase